MTALTWWFRITGIVYLVLGASWIPALSSLTLAQKIPGFDAAAGGTAEQGYLNWMFAFGIDLLVVGVFLLVGSRDPRRYLPLFWVVIALELTRGIGHDVYMIALGYPLVPNIVLGLLHLVIVATGLLAWRAARPALAQTASEPAAQPAGA